MATTKKSKTPREIEAEMEAFRKAQREIGINMAVVMYMVAGLKEFAEEPPAKIKAIAFQIALLGTNGISAQKGEYSIPAMPGKKFSGYHMLAYYYVSWALALPEHLEELKLPYEEEYKIATLLMKQIPPK